MKVYKGFHYYVAVHTEDGVVYTGQGKTEEEAKSEVMELIETTKLKKMTIWADAMSETDKRPKNIYDNPLGGKNPLISDEELDLINKSL